MLGVVVNKPFWDHLCHLCVAWLLSGNCTDSGRMISEPNETLLGECGKASHLSQLSACSGSAVHDEIIVLYHYVHYLQDIAECRPLVKGKPGHLSY